MPKVRRQAKDRDILKRRNIFFQPITKNRTIITNDKQTYKFPLYKSEPHYGDTGYKRDYSSTVALKFGGRCNYA